MFAFIRRAWEDFCIARDNKRFNKGVKWAQAEMTSARNKEVKAEELRNYTDGARLWDTYDKFDEGIDAYLNATAGIQR